MRFVVHGSSPYDIRMLLNDSCKVLCRMRLAKEMKAKFKSMINDDHLVGWLVDNLPAATRCIKRGVRGGGVTYINGFPAGIARTGRYFVNNHVKLDLSTTRAPPSGFEVEPYIITRPCAFPEGPSGSITICRDSAAHPVVDLQAHDEIVYAYDAQWTAPSGGPLVGATTPR